MEISTERKAEWENGEGGNGKCEMQSRNEWEKRRKEKKGKGGRKEEWPPMKGNYTLILSLIHVYMNLTPVKVLVGGHRFNLRTIAKVCLKNATDSALIRGRLDKRHP